MKITNFKTTLVDVPLQKPIATAIHSIRSVGCVLLELETDTGIVGESYVFTLNGIRLQALDEMLRAKGKGNDGSTRSHMSLWHRKFKYLVSNVKCVQSNRFDFRSKSNLVI